MRLNVGSIGLWATNEIGIVSPDYIVFGCDENQLNPDFLDFFRMSDGWKGQIQQSGQGSVRIRYYYRHIADFQIPLPPVTEQRAIAQVLRTVQRAKEATEKVIAATRQLKQSLMRHLFTHGPIPPPDADQVDLKDTEIGSIPVHWEITRLGDVASLSTGTTPSTSRSDYYSGDIPFIKTAEIANNIITKATTHISDQARRDYNLRLFSIGTVFVAMYGQGKTRGQVSILGIEATTTQNTAAIVCDSTLLSPYFLWLYLLSQYHALRDTGQHGQISHLNLGYMKEVQIPLPPPREQKEIAGMLVVIEDKLRAELSRRDALEFLYQALLRDLMTGNIRVPEFHPTSTRAV
jgi:type I restriction enzyme S subunit